MHGRILWAIPLRPAPWGRIPTRLVTQLFRKAAKLLMGWGILPVFSILVHLLFLPDRSETWCATRSEAPAYSTWTHLCLRLSLCRKKVGTYSFVSNPLIHSTCRTGMSLPASQSALRMRDRSHRSHPEQR